MGNSKGTKLEMDIDQEEEKKCFVKNKKLKVDEGKNISVDRISRLPDEVIKYIISFLPPKDVSATRVLSTTWRRLSPVLLHFSQWSYELRQRNIRKLIGDKPYGPYSRKLIGNKPYVRQSEVEIDQEIRAKFLDIVDLSLQSCCHWEENCRTFSLDMRFYEEEYGPRIDQWIELLAKKDFHVMSIQFGICHPHYQLPPTIFASKLLTVLRLVACYLNENCISDATTLDCLQELSLEHVHLSELILNRLISISPSITNFSLILCKGIKFLQLLDLKRLKKVMVKEGYQSDRSDWIHRIEIESRTLGIFDFYGRRYDSNYNKPACDINLQRCENLEILRLNASKLPGLFSEKLFSNFPSLKSLFLLGSHNLERVDISSPRLEELDIFSLNNMVDATIDTPNLRSFKYAGNLFDPFMFSMIARLLRKVRLQYCDFGWINASWFIKLRAFIARLSHIEVVSLSAPGRGTFDLEGVQEIPVPGPVIHVKHLKLEIWYGVSSSSSKVLVDGILWSCHPENLTMRLGGHQDIFIKVLINMLNNSEKDQMSCCKSTRIKCWRHDLKDFEIEEFTKTPKKKPLARRQNMISFRFKW